MLAGLVFAMMTMEIGLRVAGVEYHILYVADEYRGWALRPGITAMGTQEGHALVRVNADGLRDREHTKAKPENTIRIAVLGDSFTEAQGVAAEDTFWAVMEDNLRTCRAWAGLDVEVINFGVSAYGTAQELITLRRFAWDYSPDIVLLAFVENDFRDNLKISGKVRPYFTLEDGTLLLDNSFREEPSFKFRRSKQGRFLYYAVNHSRVLQIVNKNKGLAGRLRINASFLATPLALAAEAPQDRLTDKDKSIGAQATPRPQNPLPKDPKPGGADPTVELTEELIATMNREVTQRGAKFAFIYVTRGPIFRPNMTIDSVARTEKTAMEKLGEREGFPVLMLAPEFRRYAAEHRVYLHIGGGHWNETGHKLAGDLTAELLCQNGSQPLYIRQS